MSVFGSLEATTINMKNIQDQILEMQPACVKSRF